MKYIYKLFTILDLFIVIVLLAVVNQQSMKTTIQKGTIALTQPALKKAIQKGFERANVATLFPYFDELIISFLLNGVTKVTSLD